MSVRQPKPVWLRRRLPATGQEPMVSRTLDDLSLHTVCQEAHCPNQMECYGHGTATFLLLGPNCTRGCTFCAVEKHKIARPDPREPAHVAQAVKKMGLEFCVITMVTRDDMPDGGADHVARTIRAVRELNPDTGKEVLISDLGGDPAALEKVLEARPEVLNHNIETIPRLYPTVRPQADFERSIELLARSAKYSQRPVTKSGLMVGLGEEFEEILATLEKLREADCDLLTLGQYLAPSDKHHPVVRYVPPEEFEQYAVEAKKMGFKGVASGPFVRSSYQAGELWQKAKGA